MTAWLFSLWMCNPAAPDLTDWERWVVRNAPDCVKDVIWRGCCDARLAAFNAETPEWDSFEGVLLVVRRRAVGNRLPWPIDPLNR